MDTSQTKDPLVDIEEQKRKEFEKSLHEEDVLSGQERRRIKRKESRKRVKNKKLK